MKLVDWVKSPHSESEILDIFWQIVCLLQDFRKGQGCISPVLYEIDNANNVTYVGIPADEREHNEFHQRFAPPEPQAIPEKSDVFSLGMLLCFLLESGEVPSVIRSFSQNPFRKSKRAVEGSAARAKDSAPISLLMERMTSYDPTPRPSIRTILETMNCGICKFGIVLENALSGEQHSEIVRSFSSSESYRFIPEKEYVVNCVTLAPLSCEPMIIPFRLLKKQYTLKVAYASKGRWDNVRAGGDAGSTLALSIPKAAAALAYCDSVHGVEGDALFCESDGYTYEMGFYEHTRGNKDKQIKIARTGSIAAPERLEARIHSILREAEKAVYDMFCVGVYGNLSPDVIKTLNDAFPEAVRIYRLSDEDLLKGEELYAEKANATADIQEVML